MWGGCVVRADPEVSLALKEKEWYESVICFRMRLPVGGLSDGFPLVVHGQRGYGFNLERRQRRGVGHGQRELA